jgi:hypothetical protein
LSGIVDAMPQCGHKRSCITLVARFGQGLRALTGTRALSVEVRLPAHAYRRGLYGGLWQFCSRGTVIKELAATPALPRF